MHTNNVHTQSQLQARIHTQWCAPHTNTDAQARAHTCTHIPTQNTSTPMHTHAHIHTAHTHTHKHAHTRKHAHIHTHSVQALLATASYAPTVHIHHMSDASPLAILDHEAPASILAFSPDSNLLAAILENHQVRVCVCLSV